MENNTSTIETLFEKAEDYTRTTAELMKLKAVDKTADVASSMLSRGAVSIVFVMFAFLVNIGLSLWVGELLGKDYYGFFIVSGIYLIISILLYIFRDPLIKLPVSNFIIERMLKKS
ncbi:hypothetical protein LNP27_10455 [Flavobacterium galactosidilyticum]|uniref:hypothetical protein n=1 Tax=Flavobacterium galactosidilyticum TaxID=2893886 RepID=UPI001E3E8164|nr:hypothetical protein [Flavobacterium sp. F-340]UFH45554.1 hypothetical protein LNP27_10455 [Flavobacterium sp. F-340]